MNKKAPFCQISKLADNNFSGGGGGYTRRVCFVRINMHCRSKLWAYAYYHIAENCCTFCGFDFHKHNLLIFNAEFFRRRRVKMNVAFCGNYPFGKLNLSAWANQPAASGTGKVAAFTNRRRDAQGARIRKRNFNLGLRPCRPKNYYIRDGFFLAHHIDSLLAGKLPGLRKLSLFCKFCTLSEKYFNMLF